MCKTHFLSQQIVSGKVASECRYRNSWRNQL